MLTMPASVVTALESGRYAIRHMLKAYLTSGTYGLWNEDYAVVYETVTYKALGANMQVEPVPGSTELRADQMRITLTGLDSDALALIDNDDWAQRPAVVMAAFLDGAGSVLHVQPVFSGFIDQAIRSDQAGGTSTLVVMIEGNNRELSRSSDRVYSDADQRAHGGPTDSFFEQLATSNANTDIYWGQATPKSSK